MDGELQILTFPQLFVGDRLNCWIAVFSLDGTFLRCFGEKGSAPGQVCNPMKKKGGIDLYQKGVWI